MKLGLTIGCSRKGLCSEIRSCNSLLKERSLKHIGSGGGYRAVHLTCKAALSLLRPWPSCKSPPGHGGFPERAARAMEAGPQKPHSRLITRSATLVTQHHSRLLTHPIPSHTSPLPFSANRVPKAVASRFNKPHCGPRDTAATPSTPA